MLKREATAKLLLKIQNCLWQNLAYPYVLESHRGNRFMKIAIVTTAYNEAGNIADFVAQMDVVARDAVCASKDLLEF